MLLLLLLWCFKKVSFYGKLTSSPVECRQIDSCEPVEDLREDEDGPDGDDGDDDQVGGVEAVEEPAQAVAGAAEDVSEAAQRDRQERHREGQAELQKEQKEVALKLKEVERFLFGVHDEIRLRHAWQIFSRKITHTNNTVQKLCFYAIRTRKL